MIKLYESQNYFDTTDIKMYLPQHKTNICTIHICYSYQILDYVLYIFLDVSVEFRFETLWHGHLVDA